MNLYKYPNVLLFIYYLFTIYLLNCIFIINIKRYEYYFQIVLIFIKMVPGICFLIYGNNL